MLSGEPEQTPADINFALFGFHVRIHPLFWLVAVLFGPINAPPVHLVIWVVALLLSILVHELGHAVVMRIFGHRPHIVLYAMGGLAFYGSGHGYRPPRPWPHILISLAGPAAGFILAGVVLLGVFAAGYGRHVFFVGLLPIQPIMLGLEHARVSEFINDISFICVLWGAVNLLPIYPLDGGQVSRELFQMLRPRHGTHHSLMLSVLTAGAIAVYFGFQVAQQFAAHQGFDSNSLFIAVFFGYLALSSYTGLQIESGRGPW